jgi:N-acyl-D-amino-acid deacylase
MPDSRAAKLLLIALALPSVIACGSRAAPRRYDVLIVGGTVYDGSGSPGIRADVGIVGDEIKEIGDLHDADAGTRVRADGLAVAPGFVNMMATRWGR